MDEKEPVFDDEPFIKTENDQLKQLLPPIYENDEKWVQEYREQFGGEPSFF